MHTDLSENGEKHLYDISDHYLHIWSSTDKGLSFKPSVGIQ